MSKTVKATIWSLIDTYSNFFLKFVFAIWITRLLSPHDYGLIAYTGIFIAVANWLSEGGFGTALIQKREATQLDFSTGYIFNVTISIFFFLFYFFIATAVSDFFNEPELKNILRVISFTLVINSLSYIHLIKLIKNVQVKQQAIVNFTSSIISGIVGIILAKLNYGYWALVFQTLVGSIIRMLGFWIILRWIPSLKFSIPSFVEQFRFGSKIFIQGLLESISREIHSIVIGKQYNTSSLGNYSRGQKFYDLLIVQTGIAFNKVLYPTLAKESENDEKHKLLYCKAYGFLFFFMAPLSLFMILFAEPIVRILLTDKWIDAVPIMQLYFVAGFIFLLVYFNSSTLLSSNRPKLYLKMDIIQKFFFVAALVITYRFSIYAIIIGWLISYYIYYIIYEIVMFKLGFYYKDKYWELLQVLFCLVPMILSYFTSSYFIGNNYALLLVNIFIQPLIYMVTMKFFKFRVYRDFIVILKNSIPQKFLFLLK